jgi:ribosome production factor 1
MIFQNSFYYPRKKQTPRQICQYASEKGFTHVIVLNEHNKKPYSLSIGFLPNQSTLEFRVKNYVPTYEIYNKGNPSGYHPEIILKNFGTALGRRVSRGLASLFKANPEFKGRTVATFHNQRDFIFFRHHRYIFGSKEVD